MFRHIFGGKLIMPTDYTHPEQYPSYKLESEWFGLINKKAKALCRRKNQYTKIK